ncbi:gem-associated protein 8-like [Gigantopelta aegis]|uniref:gem-associated protein 8-like n=1 Tax=Gigantopelta aegis TaxID=1735272 RepID=UPI001B88D5A0|nr:gem-associated protein 8-like [Gigantopelta aegis]
MTSLEEIKLDVPADSNVVEDVVLESEVETNTSIAVDSNAEQCLDCSESDADETTDTTSQTTPLSDGARNIEHGKSTWKTFCDNFPNLNRGQWYMHHSFNTYWKHYEQAMSWYKKHLVVSKRLQRRYGSQPPPQPVPLGQPCIPPYQPYPVCSQYPGYPDNQQQYYLYSNSPRKASKQGKPKRKRSRARRKKNSKVASLDAIRNDDELVDSCETSSFTKVTETAESNMDFEITDEMLDFFAHSQKHKKEREAQKKLEAESLPEKMRVNIEEVKGQEAERTVEAPKEQPGSRRAAEIKELYGKGAAMIHGMETALQMTYDRNMDIKRPKFWPNMPFRVQFA